MWIKEGLVIALYHLYRKSLKEATLLDEMIG